MTGSLHDMMQAELDDVIMRAREFCRMAEDGEPTTKSKGMLVLARAVLHLADSLKLQRECCAAYEFEISELRAEAARLAARQMPAVPAIDRQMTSATLITAGEQAQDLRAYLQSEQRVGEGLTRDEIEAL